MSLYQQLQYSTTRKFILFFVLTTLLPILLLGTLLYDTISTKFNARITALLQSGQAFSRELYEDDLDQLKSTTKQALTLSIDEKYHYYLKTNRSAPLQNALNRFQKLKSLDLITLIDQSGHEVASTEPLQNIHPAAYKAMIRSALHDKAAVSLSIFRKPATRANQKPGPLVLMYVSVNPVYSLDHQQVIGALVIGEEVDPDTQIMHLPKILPQLTFSVIAPAPAVPGQATSPPYILSTLPADVPLKVLAEWRSEWQKHNRKPKKPIVIHHHKGNTYENVVSPLYDFSGEPIAYLIVSTSIQDELDLHRQDTAFFVIYLLLALFMVIMSGLWFKRTCINPVQSLTTISQRVAQGDLSVRAAQSNAQNEIAEMIGHVNRMLDTLQENENIRHNFISTLTHDLRTPLIAQKRVLELFEEAFNTEKDVGLAKLATKLLNSNDNLLLMVNQLLETYQYQDGHLSLHLMPVDLNNLVSACFEEAQELAQSKSISLLKNTSPGTYPVMVDAMQLKRVFQNLIGNAIENIQRGKTVTVDLQFEPDYVAMNVSDNGPGLPAQVMSNVFERYAASRQPGQKIGSGLGLFICKMIIERHGGTIQVTSIPGQGTRFTMTLPARQPSLASLDSLQGEEANLSI